MMFAGFILESGIDPNSYPNLSKVRVEYFDLEGCKLENGSNCTPPIFSKNPLSFQRFKQFLEKNKDTDISSIMVTISFDVITIKVDEKLPIIFLR